jgi:hypothetical protein
MGTPKAISLRERVDVEAPELGSNLPENREPGDDYLSGWALLSVVTALMFGAFMLALDNTVLCMYFTICVQLLTAFVSNCHTSHHQRIRQFERYWLVWLGILDHTNVATSHVWAHLHLFQCQMVVLYRAPGI